LPIIFCCARAQSARDTPAATNAAAKPTVRDIVSMSADNTVTAVTVTVHYHASWGGHQEFQRAQEAVLAGCGVAKVVEKVVGSGLKVVITAVNGAECAEVVVWEGAQRNLFAKYPELQGPTMKKITVRMREAVAAAAAELAK
jgi:hypothetical protein